MDYIATVTSSEINIVTYLDHIIVSPVEIAASVTGVIKFYPDLS